MLIQTEQYYNLLNILYRPEMFPPLKKNNDFQYGKSFSVSKDE